MKATGLIIVACALMGASYSAPRAPPVVHSVNMSVTSCVDENCTGGALWSATGVNSQACDFGAFREDVQRQFDKGRYLIFQCESNGATVIRIVHGGDPA